MAREDVFVPRFEPAATDYNPDNIDRNFNEVRDTLERLRDSAASEGDATTADLTALEGTVTTILEDVYNPTTGLASTRARIITEEGVRATADSALAARATTLEATVNDGTTGLVATRARLITEESTRASADSALAARATTLEATVNDGTTGLVATRARLITEESTRASADSALAARATTLEATVNDGTTGLVATRARLITEESTRATADTALASRATALEARSYVKGNLVKGSRPNYDATDPNNLFARFGWVDRGLWNVYYSNFVDGPYIGCPLTSVSNYSWYALRTNAAPVTAGATMSAQAMLGKFGAWNAGTIGITIYWYSDLAGTTLVSGTPNSAVQNWENGLALSSIGHNGQGRLCRVENQIVPAGAVSARIGIFLASVTGDGVYSEAGIWMLKLEYGGVSTAWTDDAMVVEVDARIRVEETTRASADTALASRATALEATVNDGTTGLVATRARLITEESTRASADAALASSITTLTAKTDGRPNLFPVPTPSPNQTPTQLGWQGTSLTTTNAPWVGGLIYYHVRASGGPVASEFFFYDIPDAALISSTDQYTLSAYGYGGAGVSGDQLRMYIEVRNDTNTAAIHASPLVTLTSDTERFSTTTTFSGGATACRIRLVFRRDYAASGSYQDTVFNMIKVEQGPNASAFTNSAQVNVQAGAIATLNSSAAFYQILVAASGGDPAIIRLFSGLGGSEVAIAARVLSLINTSSGANMEVMRAVGGEAFFSRPLSVDFSSRRLTIGPGFGVSGSEVVLWFGPSTIAPSSQSRTNCIFALGTDGQVYYGGAGLQVGNMQLDLSTYAVNLTRSGTGNTSTSVTATGYAQPTLSYSWTLHSGDGVNIGSPTSATTTIGHTLTALGQTKTSVVKCTCTSSTGPTTFRLFNISSSEIS